MHQVLFITPDNSPLASTVRKMADAGSRVVMSSTVQDTLQFLKSGNIGNIETSLILADPSIGVRAARRRLAEAGYDIPVLSAEIHASSLKPHEASQPRPLVGRPLVEVERELIIETLKAYGGNRTRTANLLGISIRTMRNKIRQYTTQGIDVPAPTSAPEIPLALSPSGLISPAEKPLP